MHRLQLIWRARWYRQGNSSITRQLYFNAAGDGTFTATADVIATLYMFLHENVISRCARFAIRFRSANIRLSLVCWYPGRQTAALTSTWADMRLPWYSHLRNRPLGNHNQFKGRSPVVWRCGGRWSVHPVRRWLSLYFASPRKSYFTDSHERGARLTAVTSVASPRRRTFCPPACRAGPGYPGLCIDGGFPDCMLTRTSSIRTEVWRTRCRKSCGTLLLQVGWRDSSLISVLFFAAAVPPFAFPATLWDELVLPSQ